jgi:hypothetical protein
VRPAERGDGGRHTNPRMRFSTDRRCFNETHDRITVQRLNFAAPFLGDWQMAERRRLPPWWWRTDVLARVVMALSAALVAGYLTRLLTSWII